MQKRIHGFLHEAIAEIKSRPGQSAHELVDRLLRGGRVQSAAVNPYPSLEGTLHKHHREHGVSRRYEGGVYRYYPDPPSPQSTHSSPVAVQDDEDVLVSLRIARRVADVADTLVAVGTVPNRASGINWLLEKGLSSLRN